MQLMQTNTLGRNILVKVKQTLAASINKKPPLPKVEKDLYKTAVDYLESVEGNRAMPWFHLKGAKTTTKNTYPDFFIAQWNRNAYGGLFIHLDPDKKNLTGSQQKWVAKFREKGYACVSVSKLHDFKILINDYYVAHGQVGKKYFNNRWERT